MIRKIIQIDEEKCNGCGACAAACHEGAIGMVNGKAKLLRDDYCDGLGDCLPACPTDAIHFVEREAATYDHEAVMKNKEEKMKPVSRLTQWPVQIKLAPVKAPILTVRSCSLPLTVLRTHMPDSMSGLSRITLLSWVVRNWMLWTTRRS